LFWSRAWPWPGGDFLFLNGLFSGVVFCSTSLGSGDECFFVALGSRNLPRARAPLLHFRSPLVFLSTANSVQENKKQFWEVLWYSYFAVQSKVRAKMPLLFSRKIRKTCKTLEQRINYCIA
jgi:hypothetical protein